MNLEQDKPRPIKVKQVIVMRKDLNMRKGKMIAQGAHAAIGALSCASKDEAAICEWEETGTTKICVSVNSEAELQAIYAQASGIGCYMVQDSGRTEFNGVPTYTCLALGPADSAKVDKITGNLPLL